MHLSDMQLSGVHCSHIYDIRQKHSTHRVIFIPDQVLSCEDKPTLPGASSQQADVTYWQPAFAYHLRHTSSAFLLFNTTSLTC